MSRATDRVSSKRQAGKASPRSREHAAYLPKLERSLAAQTHSLVEDT